MCRPRRYHSRCLFPPYGTQAVEGTTPASSARKVLQELANNTNEHKTAEAETKDSNSEMTSQDMFDVRTAYTPEKSEGITGPLRHNRTQIHTPNATPTQVRNSVPLA